MPQQVLMSSTIFGGGGTSSANNAASSQRCSIRTSEANIIATEAPPPSSQASLCGAPSAAQLMRSFAADSGGGGNSVHASMSEEGSTIVIHGDGGHHRPSSASAAALSSSNAALLSEKGDDAPFDGYLPETTSSRQQQQRHTDNVTVSVSDEGYDRSVEELQSTLAAFQPLRSSSYLSEEDLSSDLIAVAFGTFDTRLGNSIDYHYPHTAGTDGTAASSADGAAGAAKDESVWVVGAEASGASSAHVTPTASTLKQRGANEENRSRAPYQQSNDPHARRVCSIDFNRLNRRYKLQDFCFPDGSHDSFVDTIPFVITSTGSVRRLPPGATSAEGRAAASAADGADGEGGKKKKKSAGVGGEDEDDLPPYPIFGFACYHLFKDPTVHRGAVQRSFLVLSRRPLFHCLRRVARQAFVPFLDAVPATDVPAHRRFVRSVYEALFVTFSAFSDSLEVDLSGAAGAATLLPPLARVAEGSNRVASGAAEKDKREEAETTSEYAYQLRHRRAIAAALVAPEADPFSYPEDALRDVRYFSLAFDWPCPRGSDATAPPPAAILTPPLSPPPQHCDPTGDLSGGRAQRAQSVAAPFSTGSFAARASRAHRSVAVGGGRLTSSIAAWPALNPEEAPTVPITDVLRERAPTVGPSSDGANGTKSRAQSVFAAPPTPSVSAEAKPEKATSSSKKPLTTWQKFAKQKGIDISRGEKNKLVYDAEREMWVEKGTDGDPTSASASASAPLHTEDKDTKGGCEGGGGPLLPPTVSDAVAQAASALSSIIANGVSGNGSGSSNGAPSSAAADASVAAPPVAVVRIIEDKPVGSGLAACEVEVDTPGVAAAAAAASSASASAVCAEGTAAGQSGGDNSNIKGQTHSSRPPLRLNLHFPLVLPRSDASLVQQLSHGASIKTLLKWFGAERLATIHYCMLARYPILFVGQHADQVSLAVCASAHLLAPFTAAPPPSAHPSAGSSAVSFLGSAGGGSGPAFAREGSPVPVPVAHSVPSSPPIPPHTGGGGGGGSTAPSPPTSMVTTTTGYYGNNGGGHNPHSPTASAVEFDVSAFVPYATLDLMDRILEVVAAPSYENHTTASSPNANGTFSSSATLGNNFGGSGHFQQQQQQQSAGRPQQQHHKHRHGGNGVGYYIAVGATNVFVMNRDVRGMLKCNVNDGSITFCSNSIVKKSIGDSKGLVESRRLWQAAALAHVADRHLRLSSGVHYRTLVLGGRKAPPPSTTAASSGAGGGGQQSAAAGGGAASTYAFGSGNAGGNPFSTINFGSGGGGGTAGVVSIFEPGPRHIVSEASNGFLLVDDADDTGDILLGAPTPTPSPPPAGSPSAPDPSRPHFVPNKQQTTTTATEHRTPSPSPPNNGSLAASEGQAPPAVVAAGAGGGSTLSNNSSLHRPRGLSYMPAAPPHNGYSNNNSVTAANASSTSSPPSAAAAHQHHQTHHTLNNGSAASSAHAGAAASATSASLHVTFSAALANYLHLAGKNKRLLQETDGRYQRLLGALMRTVAAESGEALLALGRELGGFCAAEEAVAGPDGAVELCPSRPLDACAYQTAMDRITRLRVVVDFRQRAFCFIDALTRGNYRALVRRSNLYVSDFFLANVVGAEVYNLPQQVVLFQSDCQQVVYANRVKYKTSGTVYLTRNFLLFQAGKLALTKRHQIVPYDLVRGVSTHSKGLVFDSASVRMMVDMLPSRANELAHGSCGPNLFVDKRSMNETTALLSYTNISAGTETFYEILNGLFLKQRSVVELMRGIPPVHTVPDGGAARMMTTGGTEMVCPLWVPRGLYSSANTVVFDEVWENQRLYPIVGWKSRLLPGDPASFSDFSGLRELSTEVPKPSSKDKSSSSSSASAFPSSAPSDQCPVPGFEWIDGTWRTAFEVSEEMERLQRGEGGNCKKGLTSTLAFETTVPTTDKLLATNRGAHKALDKRENKFDEGFLYSFTSAWSAADGFRTHECAGGVIRRRLWVRRRRLVPNPELAEYHRRREAERTEERRLRAGGLMLQSREVGDEEAADSTIEPRANANEGERVGVGEGDAAVRPVPSGRQRAGHNPPPPPSRALLKKVDSLAAIFNAMQSEKALKKDGATEPTEEEDGEEATESPTTATAAFGTTKPPLQQLRRHASPTMAVSPSSPLRVTRGGGGGGGLAASTNSRPRGVTTAAHSHLHLSPATLRLVPDGSGCSSPLWRRQPATAQQHGGGVDGAGFDCASSVSTDSTDVIDPSEVEESLSAPTAEENDDGGAFSTAHLTAARTAATFLAGRGGGGAATAESDAAAAAEAARRARIDAEASHLPPQWDGHRKALLERDELL